MDYPIEPASEDTAAGLLKKHWPFGSLVVDVSLVVLMAFSWGQMASTLKTIDERVHQLEVVRERPDPVIEQHFKSIEATIQRQDMEAGATKADLKEQLDRIERKLDRVR